MHILQCPAGRLQWAVHETSGISMIGIGSLLKIRRMDVLLMNRATVECLERFLAAEGRGTVP